MHSPAAALAWELWGRHRWGLSAVLFYLLAFAVVINVLPAGDVNPQHALLGSIQFVFALVYVTAVFAYGFESRLEARESGFPARLFTLPVRTSVLVGWPMLQGVAAVALLWLAWSRLVLQSSGVDVSLGSTVLLAAAFVAVLQALLWSPFGLPWLRIGTAFLILPLLVLVPLFRPLFRHPFDITEQGLRAGLAALIPLAYLAALVGVSRARHGDSPQWRGTAARPETAEGWPSSRLPFATAARARFWFEWRAHGRTFPLVVGCVVVVQLSWSLWIERKVVDQPLAVVLIVAVLLLSGALLLAPFLGCSLGRSGTAAGDALPLSSFTATRPAWCVDWVTAKIKVAALNSLAAWALLLLAVSIWITHKMGSVHVSAAWDWLVREYQTWRVWSIIALAAVGLLLLIWKFQVDSLFLGLAGRRWLYRAGLLAYGVAFTAGFLLLCNWATQQDFFDPIGRNLEWWMGGAVALKLLAGGWIMRSLLRRGIVGMPALARILAVWLLAALVLFAFAWVVLPPGSVSPVVLAFAVVLSLPLARAAAAPLALAWNRHR
jgi:hypothetical protein